MVTASDHRNRGFGDGDEERIHGVRSRGYTVEVKPSRGGVGFYKEVKTMSKWEAGVVHDLARIYDDPSVDEERLNVAALVRRIVREIDPTLAASGLALNIGKSFLSGFVEKHPLERAGSSRKSRTDAIADLGPIAYAKLEAEVARELSWRRGRQRADLREIHDPVEQDDDLLKEIQDPKATIDALNAKIISLNEAYDAALQTRDAALQIRDAALKAMDAAQKGRDIVMEELYAATARAAIVSPFKHGFAEQEGFLLQNEDIKPDAFTYASILNPHASAGAVEWVKEVHGYALKAGLESDLRLGCALVQMYAKCGSLDDARVVFGRMEEHDAISWNIMIGGLTEHGFGLQAYELFHQVQQEGIKPENALSITSEMAAR